VNPNPNPVAAELSKATKKEPVYKPLSQLEPSRSSTATPKSTKKPKAAAKLALNPASSSTSANAVNGNKENVVNESTAVNETAQKQPRKIATKPQWEPNEVVVAALESFRELVNSLTIKLPLPKSAAIPHSLDEGLLALHKQVLSSYSSIIAPTSSSSSPAADPSRAASAIATDFLRTTTGYYEAIADILGGLIPPGRVKLAIYQQECKEKSINLRLELDSLHDSIRELIPSRVVAITAPDEEKTDATPMEEKTESEAQALVSAVAEEQLKCSWNAELRKLLMNIEDKAISWAAAENIYRRSLSTHDKLLLSSEETEALEYKDVIINTLTCISSYFPSHCLNIDASSLRKQISVERSRVKKLTATIDPTSQSSSSSTAATMLISSVKPTVMPNLVIPSIRIMKEKPEWNMNQQLGDDLAAFGAQVVASNIKLPLAKSAHIPHALDDALLALHRNVKAHVTLPPSTTSIAIRDAESYLNRTTGYYEAIADIFGGQISIMRVRNAIAYAEFKDLAQKHRAELNQSIDAFKTLIASNIVEGLFEDKANSIAVGDHNILYDEASRESISSLPEPSMLMTEESQVSRIDSVAKASTAEPMEEASAESSAAAAEAKIYHRKCTWTPELRSALFNVDVAVSTWCKSENSFRSSFTAFDKKALLPSECEDLKERDVLSSTLEELAHSFPADCLHADLTTIRHYLSLEKRR
jgi:hypothetical protein